MFSCGARRLTGLMSCPAGWLCANWSSNHSRSPRCEPVAQASSGLACWSVASGCSPAAAPAPTVTQLLSSTATVTATTTVNMPGPTTVITETVSAAPFAQPHSVPAGTPIASATVAATAVPEAPVEQVDYPNCAAARAAGAAPVYSGEPGYGTQLDRDRDGIGCE